MLRTRETWPVGEQLDSSDPLRERDLMMGFGVNSGSVLGESLRLRIGLMSPELRTASSAELFFLRMGLGVAVADEGDGDEDTSSIRSSRHQVRSSLLLFLRIGWTCVPVGEVAQEASDMAISAPTELRFKIAGWKEQ